MLQKIEEEDSFPIMMKTGRAFLVAIGLWSVSAMSESIQISGVVQNPNGEPVAGADVHLLQTPLFAVTNAEGGFLLTYADTFPTTELQLEPAAQDEFAIKPHAKSLHIQGPRQPYRIELHDITGKRLREVDGQGGLTRVSLEGLNGKYQLSLIEGKGRSVHQLLVLDGIPVDIVTEKSARYPIPSPLQKSSASAASYSIQAGKNGLSSAVKSLSTGVVEDVVLIIDQEQTLETPADLVDLFISTAGDFGQLYPAAEVPWGMVKLGPDNRGHAGFDLNLDWLGGFSHTRLGGVGCSGSGGTLLITPGVESFQKKIKYDKQSQSAMPGYYKVRLNNGVKAEMTAGMRVGMHCYTFPASNEAMLHFDLSHSFEREAGYDFEVHGQDEITGTISAKTVCKSGTYTLHFAAKFNKPFQKADGTTFYFHTSENEQVLIKVGFSTISPEQARIDRDAQVSGWDFEQLRYRARERWNKVLGKVEITGGRPDWRTLFYTMLYRSYNLPVEIVSTDGRYRGTDGNIHQSEGFTRYHGWSIWDTFRSKFPLLTITEPARSRDMMQSLVTLYAQGKDSWANEKEPYPTVRTEHAAAVMIDAWRKGIRGFDITAAYPKMKRDVHGHAFEKAWDHWCVAQLARELGKEEDYQEHMQKASGWEAEFDKNYVDLSGGKGEKSGGYEATKWQYRWSVFHDQQKTLEKIGGRERYINDLTYFFDTWRYNMGNQPDIQAPWLFHYGAQPWLTQKWVRTYLTKKVPHHYGTHGKFKTPYVGKAFKPEPEGFIPEMDDDGGTMSAWYVLGAMGLFQTNVGDPVWLLGSPLFEKIRIHLDGEMYAGRVFTIRTENNSEDNMFVQSATLNGNSWNQSWIKHEVIAGGGELVYRMGSEPNKDWASDPAKVPPSMTKP